MTRDVSGQDLELFFDCASPWSYIGLVAARRIADRLGARTKLRPVVAGGGFRLANPDFVRNRSTTPPAKAAYLIKDLGAWSEALGLSLSFPPPVFPVDSIQAMRVCLAADRLGRGERVALALFEAYFGRGEDIGDPGVVAAALRRCRAGAGLLTLAQEPAIGDALRDNSEELVRRGGFGVPTAFVDDDMFFGADRRWLAQEALLRRRAGAVSGHGRSLSRTRSFSRRDP